MESQVNKIYWVKCPDQPDWYRSVRIHKNPFTGHHQTQLSNPAPMPPPPDMPEIPPLMRTKLMRMNNALPHTY